jgi:hypothetical protein
LCGFVNNPDDPRLQQECADRLLAYAEQLRAALDDEEQSGSGAETEPEPERKAA